LIERKCEKMVVLIPIWNDKNKKESTSITIIVVC